MRKHVVTIGVLLALLLGACSNRGTGNSTGIPGTALKQAESPWWRHLNDPALDRDIEKALGANPGLRAVALRVAEADAAVTRAGASFLPNLTLGLGYSEGRTREMGRATYTLAPWETGARFSWELDLSGKLGAARRSTEEDRNSAVWDYHSARLLLASRIAASRFNLYRFNREIRFVEDSLTASADTLRILEEKSGAGIISDSVVSKQRAEHERFAREQLELIRLRDLTVVQLRTLRGGTNPGGISQADFPTPDALRDKPLALLLQTHPTILAANARVRSAFQLEQSARLDLLPSFGIGAGASGRSGSLASRYLTWMTQIGPSLEIPIYDPARLATVKIRRAEQATASANYREKILEILEEIDRARINLRQRAAQLAAVRREVAALDTTRSFAREQFEAGLISQIEYLDTERRWLEARRTQAMLTQAHLSAHLDLRKAFGGGPA